MRSTWVKFHVTQFLKKTQQRGLSLPISTVERKYTNYGIGSKNPITFNYVLVYTDLRKMCDKGRKPVDIPYPKS